MAGIMAWGTEVGVAMLGLYLLKKEEMKVMERRRKRDG